MKAVAAAASNRALRVNELEKAAHATCVPVQKICTERPSRTRRSLFAAQCTIFWNRQIQRRCDTAKLCAVSNFSFLSGVSKKLSLGYVFGCREPAVDALSTPSIGARPLIVVQDMSTRLPDLSPQEYLSDAIHTIPLDRWEVDAIPESNLGGRFGGFVKTWAKFDAAAFSITPSEAALMDPQQRVMLEVRPDFS